MTSNQPETPEPTEEHAVARPEDAAGQSASDKPDKLAEVAESEGLSTARKIRFAFLLLILLVVAGVALYRYVDRRTAETERQQQLAEALGEARGELSAMRPLEALQVLQRAAELEPANQDVARLAVAALYASGQMEPALAEFNRLSQGLVAEIHQGGREYIRRCGLLWNLARRITTGADSDRQRALALCRWFALYLMPLETAPEPGEPVLVALQGYGRRRQMAWTYVALARQVDVPCVVVVTDEEGTADHPLIEVHPREGEPFLLDPWRAVPVMDQDSGELLSLENVRADPAAFARWLALAGLPADPETEPFASARRLIAAHPAAMDARFGAFEQALMVLQEHPRLVLTPARPEPEAAEDLWEYPEQVLSSAHSPEALDRAYQAARLVAPGRNKQLLGDFQGAAQIYSAMAQDLESKLAEADVESAATAIGQALEDVHFYQGTNLHEAGRLEAAQERISRYLEQYPDGRWQPLARVLLADIRAAEGATQAWTNLPPSRRLYGALREKGLLPGPRVVGAAGGVPADSAIATQAR
ncbi:MAG: bacterial transcriptional activator domain-containing protein [Candidatus Brocadiia bacterium]